MEFISEDMFVKYSNITILGLKFLEFFMPSALKNEKCSAKNQGKAMGMQMNRLIPYLIWAMQ